MNSFDAYHPLCFSLNLKQNHYRAPSSFAHNEWLKNAFKFIDDHQNNTVVDNDCVPTIIQSFLSETLRCHSMAAAVIATAYQNVLIGNSRRFRRGHVAPKDVDLNIFVDLLSVNAVLNKTSSYRIESNVIPDLERPHLPYQWEQVPFAHVERVVRFRCHLAQQLRKARLP